MPHRRLPNTVSSVLRTLTASRDAWTKFPADRLITDAQFAKLDPADPNSLLNRLIKEAGDIPLALAAQAPLTDAFNKGLAKLTLYVSHFHQVYDLGVARGTFTAGGRVYFGRDITASTLPNLTSIAAVLEAGKAIVEGEPKRAAAEGASHVPMALPSAAEVAAIYNAVKAQADASDRAKAFTDQQQNELALIYPEAQKLAVSICNTVEFNLGERDGLDAAGQRAIARKWGVVYIYDSNETPDPGDENAANTTLENTPAITPTK